MADSTPASADTDVASGQDFIKLADDTKNNKSDLGQDTDTTTISQSAKSDNQNNDDGAKNNNNEGKKNTRGGSGTRERRNAKWKSNWKEKKDARKRQRNDQQQKSDGNGDGDGGSKKGRMGNWKKKYDEGTPVPPHEGSFANENMQKLFNVTIDADVKVKAGDDKDKPATDNETNTENATEEAAATKIPKRKMAILTSFLGTNYSGFQINSEQRTLQSELELGLYRAGMISKQNFGHPSKYGWSNSARTDKGVHAAAQVCSFKGEMIFHNDKTINVGDEESAEGMRKQMDAMRVHVNKFLPEDVRVLDIERVTRMFCARTARDKVRYQYMVPSYLLCSPKDVKEAFAAAGAAVEGEVTTSKASGVGTVSIDNDSDEKNMTPMEASAIINDTIDPAILAKAREALIDHRITPEQMEQLKEGLKLFEGTHNFHNYTRRVGANEGTAQRYMMSFKPLDPILVPYGDGDDSKAMQWIPLQVVGQSFLLNQIRKMVSAAVDHGRGVVSGEKIKESLTKDFRIKVNVAPAQGLFLDRSFFELYNKHKIKNAPKHGDARDRDTLDWVEVEGEEMPAAVRRTEEFKNEKIIPHIVQEEVAEGNFLKYLYTQDVLYAHKVYRPMEDDGPAPKDKKKAGSDQKDDDGDADVAAASDEK